MTMHASSSSASEPLLHNLTRFPFCCLQDLILSIHLLVDALISLLPWIPLFSPSPLPLYNRGLLLCMISVLTHFEQGWCGLSEKNKCLKMRLGRRTQNKDCRTWILFCHEKPLEGFWTSFIHIWFLKDKYGFFVISLMGTKVELRDDCSKGRWAIMLA